MASTELTKTFSASNRKTWTFSAWIKFSGFSGVGLFAAYADSSNRSYFGINGSHQLLLYAKQSGSDTCSVYSTQVFRDPSAWYHIMCVCDTTQSTPTDRVKFYVNGSQADVTFSHTPDQNEDLYLNGGYEHAVGSRDGSSYFDGLMSHVHFADGTAYTPSTFGSTDSTTGEWKINTSPTVTYGTNGFFILKDGNGVTDQSGNSNNFTVGAGTLTTLQDCPSDNFATMNPLDNYYFDGTFTNGNNTVQSGNSSYAYCSSTIHVSSGKYYWEIKADSPHSAMRVGIGSKLATSTSDNLGNDTDGEAVVYPSGATKVNNVDNPNSWSGTSWTTGDILGFAMDLDNNKLYISKNGTFMNSGSPTSGSTGTGALSLTAAASTPTGAYFVAWGDNYSSGNATMSHNFGNGYFGTTAISSEGTNASGIGKFEYDVPTGYTALSTKGLNE